MDPFNCVPPNFDQDGRTLYLAPLTTEPESMLSGFEVLQPEEPFVRFSPIVPETLQGAIYERSYKM